MSVKLRQTLKCRETGREQKNHSGRKDLGKAQREGSWKGEGPGDRGWAMLGNKEREEADGCGVGSHTLSESRPSFGRRLV